MPRNNIKHDLDMLNYGCSVDDLIDRDSLSTTTTLSKYHPDKLIEEEFMYVLRTINELNDKYSKDWHLGVISSGSHSEDFCKSYDFEIDNLADWNNDPVMLVYECPGNNIDASHAMEKNRDFSSVLNEILQENNTDELFKKLLCKTLWHADCGKKEYYKKATAFDQGSFLEFGESHYAQFLLQLILEFKLSNLYTTNLFRYEIFEIKEKRGKQVESSINLNGILWPETKCNEYYEKLSLLNDNMVVFKKELEIVKPKVIFATSSPYYCINQYYEKEKSNNSDLVIPVIVKVPHPASYISSIDRYLINAFRITKTLETAGVITPDFANKKLAEAYRKMNIN